MSAPTDEFAVALLLADARMPAGGHAYSSGLEPGLFAGVAPDRVPDLMISRARTMSLVEAGTAVAARHAIITGGGLKAVQQAWEARTPAPAVRDAGVQLGRGYLRLAGSVWPHATRRLTSEVPLPAKALVLGAVAAETGLAPDQLARIAVYDEAAGAAAALLKLAPRDPAETTAWVLAACRAAEPRLPQVAAVTEPHTIPAWGAPLSEEWAQAHSRQTKRLFRG